jgi:hypothetical protein
VKPLSALELQRRIHALFFKTGILEKKIGTKRYELNVHCIRKFFRTQMCLLGVEKNYIEYMMGHKTDPYFDVEVKGVDYFTPCLRHV